MANELVRETQRKIFYLAAADDDGACLRGAANQPHVSQHGFVFAKAEGTRGRDKLCVSASFEVANEGFNADRRGEINGVVDGVAFTGIDADELFSVS